MYNVDPSLLHVSRFAGGKGHEFPQSVLALALIGEAICNKTVSVADCGPTVVIEGQDSAGKTFSVYGYPDSGKIIICADEGGPTVEDVERGFCLDAE